MTPEERKRLAKVIALTASYYGKEIQREVISMMLDDLDTYDPDAVEVAYKNYRLNPKNTAFPLPAKIIALIEPEIDERTLANDLARRIEKAIRRFGNSWAIGITRKGENGPEVYFEGGGYAWPTWEQAVRAELGEVGFEAVRRYGWSAMEQNYFSMDRGIFFAQLRELIESVLRLSAAGLADTLPRLPSGQPRGAQVGLTASKEIIGKMLGDGGKKFRQSETEGDGNEDRVSPSNESGEVGDAS